MTTPRPPQYPIATGPRRSNITGLLVAILSVLLMICLWIFIHIAVAASQWHNCGESPGRSVVAAVLSGKPSGLECLELEYAKQTRK